MWNFALNPKDRVIKTYFDQKWPRNAILYFLHNLKILENLILSSLAGKIFLSTCLALLNFFYSILFYIMYYKKEIIPFTIIVFLHICIIINFEDPLAYLKQKNVLQLIHRHKTVILISVQETVMKSLSLLNIFVLIIHMNSVTIYLHCGKCSTLSYNFYLKNAIIVEDRLLYYI